MAIKRMNHAVLYVRNADRTFAFYRDVLGFRVVNEMPGAKFLQAPDSTNDHDLGIFEIGEAAGDSTAGRATVGLYHIAWEVQTLARPPGDRGEARRRRRAGRRDRPQHDEGALRQGPRRPGVRGVLARAGELLTDESSRRRRGRAPLDIDADIERYGLETVGGISRSAEARRVEMLERRIQIRWRDMDGFGHVNNAVFLTYLEEGRDEFMAAALREARGPGRLRPGACASTTAASSVRTTARSWCGAAWKDRTVQRRDPRGDPHPGRRGGRPGRVGDGPARAGRRRATAHGRRAPAFEARLER